MYVGSGITALTHAALIVDRNPALRVLILEQHDVPGGYATEFCRPKLGARFDCSLHKLSGMGPQGNLRALFRELGLEDKIRLFFPPTFFEVVSTVRLSLPEDARATQLCLTQMFPTEEVALGRFFAEVATYGRDGYMQFETLQGNYEPDFKQLRWAHRNLKPLTVAQALRQRFGDSRLIEILSLPSIYVGCYPEQCAYLYFLHVVYASLFMRSAYLEGGSQHLSNLLVKKLRLAGSDVRTNVDVERIEVDSDDGSQATGVVACGQLIRCSHVYVNASPEHAMRDLLPNLDALQDLRRRAREQIPANSTSTIYLLLDTRPDLIGLGSAETMVLAEAPEQAEQSRALARSSPTDAEIAENAYWVKSSFEVTNYALLSASGGNVVIVNVLDDVRHWPERKTAEYRAKKRRLVQVVLSRLFRAIPALESHVKYREVSTPRTCERYTRNKAGSGYGALVSPYAAAGVSGIAFPVGNVSFLSAWVSGSGYEATMGFARLMARSVQLSRHTVTANERAVRPTNAN
ncbi:phytoene desaturase family protein [Verminephrobacter aporrectodeae]|uniref:phytoene desaturase family protein n=1 Tax=Verminephrobacter aporrectodeae TaxID=1110389 RepID=UPI00191BF10D|nr:NAD(P)/FAD-dependent oxidoreductase [Verminephrobacter aporrectodeae]